MITMTDIQLQKIDLLDKLFGALNVDQLREFTESEQIVSRLQGNTTDLSIIRNLIQTQEFQALEIMQLKNDIRDLIRAVTTMTTPIMHSQPYSPELQNLKSRHGIY